jgi:hypothetical protein
MPPIALEATNFAHCRCGKVAAVALGNVKVPCSSRCQQIGNQAPDVGIKIQHKAANIEHARVYAETSRTNQTKQYELTAGAARLHHSGVAAMSVADCVLTGGMLKYHIRFDSRRPWVTVSSIRPAAKLRNASSIRPVDSIAVGNRGTSPVLEYSRKIGHASRVEDTARRTNAREKNASGRSSLISLVIVRKIRRPSLNVLSLLIDPCGRSL